MSVHVVVAREYSRLSAGHPLMGNAAQVVAEAILIETVDNFHHTSRRYRS